MLNGWEEQNQQISGESRNVLDRTTASIARSNQISIETEQIGTEILSELSEQRESLLRTQNRLESANDNLSKSSRVLRGIKRNVIYNKLTLILIILFEIGILIGLILIKFVLK